MSDKLPTTRRGIYLTNLQWADAKAAGDGNYSAGVRLCLDDREELAKRNDELAARLTDRISRRNKVEALEAEKVERDATIERYIFANNGLILQVDNLTVERDTLNRECAALAECNIALVRSAQTKCDKVQAECDEASLALARRVFEVEELRAQVRPFPRLVFALGFLAAIAMAIAATLAVLEGIDKAWWGWTL